VFALQAYLKGSEFLDTVRTFTSLALIHLLAYPASRLLSAVPQVAATLGCFERIQHFLIRSEHATEDAGRTQLVALNQSNGLLGGDSGEIEPLFGNYNADDSHVNDIRISETMIMSQHANIAIPSGKIILKDLNLSVPRGSILCITGPVGSGKSILLKSLMGQISCLEGSIRLAESSEVVGYCAQTPWIPHGTIKDIICGLSSNDGGDFDTTWYHTVLEACALIRDIDSFTYGDATTVGSRAAKLSGGQKQRLALARALFPRPGLLFLDNVFSALDTSTKHSISERLFGPKGVLRSIGSTVLMVTYDGMCSWALYYRL
jgi:ATP-binding cassette, subfamily C (CFTR/MRP), member 1